MDRRLKKVLLLLLAAVLLASNSFSLKSLNAERKRLGLTRVEPLHNAPPVLAFTTVALGGFRGLISNALWIRANDLQEQDKFFEMAQLADWITKLEPHFVQVWLVQAWNMAYNISVKFTDYGDRWRWVQRGIELLRDDGLRYNPNEILIYRELAWFFQHKMGHNLDDANMHYKQQWANQMAEVFAKQKPNLDELLNPSTDDQRRRLQILTNKFKMDPAVMKTVDDRFGPVEWRLPEAHAIYWAFLGLQQAERNPSKIKPDDLITLRRAIYQSMQLSFHRGRLVPNPFTQSFEFGPNLDIIPKVSAAYEQAASDDASNREHILRAHRNFLRDAVYFLYEHNRMEDAARWYQYLSTQYPNKTLIDGRPDSLPRNTTLDEYCMFRIQEDISETGRDRVKAAIEGLLVRRFMSMALGEDDRSAGLKLLAQKILAAYHSKITAERMEAIGLPSIEDTEKVVLQRLLDPAGGFPEDARAVIRTRLGLPAEEPPAPPAPNSTTNTPPATLTNTPAAPNPRGN